MLLPALRHGRTSKSLRAFHFEELYREAILEVCEYVCIIIYRQAILIFGVLVFMSNLMVFFGLFHQ